MRIEMRHILGYKRSKGKILPSGGGDAYGAILLDVLAQIVAGLLVVLILRLWR